MMRAIPIAIGIIFAVLLSAAPALALLPFGHGGGTTSGGAVITSFVLNSASSGTLDFTVGQGFKDGDAPISGVVTDAASSQVKCMDTFPSGKCSFAIISGTYVSSGSPVTIHVATGTPPTGTNITCPTNLNAVANLGASGTVNASGLTAYASPVSGPEMTRCLYKSTASGGELTLFYADIYKDGNKFVQVISDNGYVDLANSDKSYTATLSVGGANVFGPTAITHYANTRLQAEGWTGTAPGWKIAQATPYLVSTKFVPNYFMDTPSSTALNGLVQSYTPFNNGPWTPHMGDTGFQNQIGWLPLWDALYITSLGDSRAYSAIIAASESLGAYPVIWRGSSDTTYNQGFARPSVYPNYTFFGNFGGGGVPNCTGNSLCWDGAHFGSAGYFCYLITARQDCYDMMAAQAAMTWLETDQGYGAGVNRPFLGQNRGVAWDIRAVSQFLALANSGDLLAADLIQNFVNTATTYWTPNIGANGLGIVYDYQYATGAYNNNAVTATANNGSGLIRATVSNLNGASPATGGMATGDTIVIANSHTASLNGTWVITVIDGTHIDLQGSTFSVAAVDGDIINGTTAGWMLDWWTWGLGQALDMQIFTGSNLTTITNSFNEVAKWVVGRLGDGSAGTWCYDDFAAYNAVVGNVAEGSVNTHFSSFGTAWGRSVGDGDIVGGTCTTTLRGGGSAAPSTAYNGYWGNGMPGMAEAYDHGVSGAVAGVNRFLGAANYSTVRNSGFADVPIFGVQHR